MMNSPLSVPSLNWERARQRIKDFNSSQAPYYLAEVALNEVFQRELTADTVPLCIMAVDSFWKANLAMEPRALQAICESTARNAGKVSEIISDVQRYALPLNDRDLAYVVRIACALLPQFLKSAESKRIHYSFATKFLH